VQGRKEGESMGREWIIGAAEGAQQQDEGKSASSELLE